MSVTPTGAALGAEVAVTEAAASTPTGPTRQPRRAGIRSLVLVAAFCSPALAVMALFLLVPTIQSVQYSFFDWNGLSVATPLGLGNYVELFSDNLFRRVLRQSLILAVVATLGTMLVGLLWAYGIERRLPGWRAYRFLLFIPVIIPQTVTALLWRLLLDVNGPVNQVLEGFGIALPPDWLGDPGVALGVVTFVAIWQGSGFTMLLILGAMEDVPAELHDAASLDGASSLRRLVSIVIPQIRTTLSTLAVIQFIGLLKAFDIVFALTSGGPGNSTDVLGTYLVQKAFTEGRYGYGSAVAVAITVLLLVINVVTYRRLLGKDAQ